jgi:hypothetical protein
MKQTLWLLLIIVILGGATTWFFINKKQSTIQNEMREFAVKDTAAITKIFLTNRNKNYIILERGKSNKWILNHKDHPKEELVDNLLECIYRVEVRSPVANAAYNNVVKTLAASAIKCEIYLHDDSIPSKVFYVGGPTEDDLGTFMMLQNSNQPFITHIPGFNGYLTPRFTVKPEDWESTALFSYDPQEIKSVMINYANAPAKSFVIFEDKGRYQVINPNTNQFIQQIDSIAVENYLLQYRNIYYESIVKSNIRDTLSLQPPAIRISIKDSNKGLKELQIFPKLNSDKSRAQVDSLGRMLKYDLDRVYGLITPGEILVTIQQPILNRLLRQWSDFDVNKPALKRGR